MLKASHVHCSYGDIQVLRDVSFELHDGEILGLLGRNGAGKTSTLRAIMGLLKPRSGSINLNGSELTSLPTHKVPSCGIGYVPQGRRLFGALSVEDNLRMGVLARNNNPEILDGVLQLFPVLRERLQQRAATLSGGEQQMLATARALCLEPKVLLLDEPSEGLAPAIVQKLLITIAELRRQRGVGVLLVEQNVKTALTFCDRILFLEGGTIAQESTPDALARDPLPLERYVGVRRSAPDLL
jgi:branched-chain amino acid transport system ATP-binding protein